MKVLYHHRTLGDGAEGIHVSSMVRALESLGHEVRVTALIGEKTNVETTRSRLLTRVTKRLPRALYEGAELGYSLVGYRMLRRDIRPWHPDVLYERYTLYNLAGLWAARRSRIPLLLEVNAPLAHERAAWEQLALPRFAHASERYICSHATTVIVVSTPLKDYLVSLGVPADRIVVMPNGADPEIFRPDPVSRGRIRSALGIPDDALVIGFSGILRPWHGVELLVDAIGRSPLLRQRAYLLIVGDGPSRASIEEQARRVGLEGRLRITGRVPHAQIPEHIAAFDVGVSPRATFYASPMKVPEYMAVSVPVVAPRLANLQDLIVDGVDGLLFEAENVDDLAQRLESVAADDGRRLQLAAEARNTIVSRRTWRHNAQRVIELASAGR